MKKRDIPNALSILRILLVPWFVFLFCSEHLLAAIFVFLFAGLTDVVDGYLARHNGWTSEVGKILDPIADKLMQCTVLICFAAKHMIPLWLPLVYISKELLMAIGAIFIFQKQSRVVKSSFWGKFAVCVFYASIVALVAVYRFVPAGAAGLWREGIGAVMIAFAFFAVFQYFREYFRSGS